jgi:hypothetical protein
VFLILYRRSGRTPASAISRSAGWEGLTGRWAGTSSIESAGTPKLTRKQPWETLLSDGVDQTPSRTVLTPGLTFIAVWSLFLFGSEVLRGCSCALMVGVLVESCFHLRGQPGSVVAAGRGDGAQRRLWLAR